MLKKIISIALIVILMSFGMMSITFAITQHGGLFSVNVVVVDDNNQPIQGVKLNLECDKLERGNGVNLGNDSNAVTNSSGTVRLYAKFTEASGTWQQTLNILDVPEGYSNNLQLKYSFGFDSNLRITNYQTISGQELLAEQPVYASDVSSLDGIAYYSADDVSTDYVFSIKIKLPKENSTSEGSPNISVQTVAGVGNLLCIASDNNSEHASITVAEAVQYLRSQGRTATSIKDINGNNISLNSTDFIGTGTIISTSNGDYKVVVYGDATGDGEVDASDINVVVQSFLGNISNLSEVVEMAADIQQDGDLNASDITLMIQSFLGSLQGSILQGSDTSTQISYPQTLANVVKVGDYVNYPNTYSDSISNATWRVLTINNNEVELASDFTMELDCQNDSYLAEALYNSWQDPEPTISYILRNQQQFMNYYSLVNTQYAKDARLFVYDDVTNILGKEPTLYDNTNASVIKNSMIDVGFEYLLSKGSKGESYGYCYRIAPINQWTEYKGEAGSVYIGGGADAPYDYIVHRVVVKLKNGIQTSAGNGKKSTPWQLIAQ